MNPHDLLIAMWTNGLTVRLASDGVNLAVFPAGRMTTGQRDLVLAHKQPLIALLVEAHTTTEALIAAAMRRCDECCDGQQARADMRRDCLALPPHLRADLLEHFQGKPTNLPR